MKANAAHPTYQAMIYPMGLRPWADWGLGCGSVWAGDLMARGGGLVAAPSTGWLAVMAAEGGGEGVGPRCLKITT
jgi:hypothetical protein